MKTMNLWLIIGLVLLNSCVNQDLTDKEDLMADQLRSRIANNEVYSELWLHQNFLEGEMQFLERKKAELLNAIESGNTSVLEELEQTIRELEQNRELYSFNEKYLGRLPRPPKPLPNPCGDPDEVLNCPALILKGGLLTLLSLEKLGDIHVLVKDERDRVVAEVYETIPSREVEGAIANKLEIRAGDYALTITKQDFLNGNTITYGIHIHME
tara:strand:+ start:4025 stop:4660 length:636 start_codon:yes stop_codon:yes gene_type:complete